MGTALRFPRWVQQDLAGVGSGGERGGKADDEVAVFRLVSFISKEFRKEI